MVTKFDIGDTVFHHIYDVSNNEILIKPITIVRIAIGEVGDDNEVMYSDGYSHYSESNLSATHDLSLLSLKNKFEKLISDIDNLLEKSNK